METPSSLADNIGQFQSASEKLVGEKFRKINLGFPVCQFCSFINKEVVSIYFEGINYAKVQSEGREARKWARFEKLGLNFGENRTNLDLFSNNENSKIFSR